MINENAPDFILENLTGDSISLKSLYGKVVVLDFGQLGADLVKLLFLLCKKLLTSIQQILI